MSNGRRRFIQEDRIAGIYNEIATAKEDGDDFLFSYNVPNTKDMQRIQKRLKRYNIKFLSIPTNGDERLVLTRTYFRDSKQISIDKIIEDLPNMAMVVGKRVRGSL